MQRRGAIYGSRWAPLLAVKEEVYEDLFFLDKSMETLCENSMQISERWMGYKIIGKGTTIILDEEILGGIIGARFEIDTWYFGNTQLERFQVDYDTTKENLVTFLEELQPNKFSASALSFEHRIMAHIIRTTTLPRIRSLEV